MLKGRYVPGDYKAVCDVCGFEYMASQLRRRWDGRMVCRSDWEPRHPQDLLRTPRENTRVPWSRPEGPDRFVSVTFYGGVLELHASRLTSAIAEASIAVMQFMTPANLASATAISEPVLTGDSSFTVANLSSATAISEAVMVLETVVDGYAAYWAESGNESYVSYGGSVGTWGVVFKGVTIFTDVTFSGTDSSSRKYFESASYRYTAGKVVELDSGGTKYYAVCRTEVGVTPANFPSPSYKATSVAYFLDVSADLTTVNDGKWNDVDITGSVAASYDAFGRVYVEDATYRYTAQRLRTGTLYDVFRTLKGSMPS